MVKRRISYRREDRPHSTASVNRIFKAEGITGVECVQGRGYVYLTGPAVEHYGGEQSAQVYRARDLSFGSWVDLARERVAASAADEPDNDLQTFDSGIKLRLRKFEG